MIELIVGLIAGYFVAKNEDKVKAKIKEWLA